MLELIAEYLKQPDADTRRSLAPTVVETLGAAAPTRGTVARLGDLLRDEDEYVRRSPAVYPIEDLAAL